MKMERFRIKLSNKDVAFYSLKIFPEAHLIWIQNNIFLSDFPACFQHSNVKQAKRNQVDEICIEHIEQNWRKCRE